MSVRGLIQQAVQKDATGFEDKFNDIMTDRMVAAIETKYTSMFSQDDFAGEAFDVETDE